MNENLSRGADGISDGAEADASRARIIAAAAQLIADGGRDAATTRAVAAAAAVQAPTIYRLFGDKRGLLDAVAEQGLARFVAGKSTRKPHPDPVQDLRDGFDLYVAFGLANPGLFAIMSGDPHPRSDASAVTAGMRILRERMRRIALAGRLQMSEERAIGLLHSVAVGTVLNLLSHPVKDRDRELPKVARETALAAITGKAMVRADRPKAAAAALRACLDHTTVLSAGEKLLLEELLIRISNSNE